MAQNRSSAVMQQRAHNAPNALEYFPTPPWATRALCHFLQAAADAKMGKLWPQWHRCEMPFDLAALDCWEPTCGELHMVKPLREFFGCVRATDVYCYGPDHGLHDFLGGGGLSADFLIFNPPFKPAAAFLAAAMPKARKGVAMLLRTSWSEGAQRYRAIFRDTPPTYELQFSQRVVMLQGRLIQEGKPDPFNLNKKTGLPRKASTATSYAWFIWLRDMCGDWIADTRHRWIPPIRKDLECVGDYPDFSAEIAEVEARARARQSADQEALFT